MGIGIDAFFSLFLEFLLSNLGILVRREVILVIADLGALLLRVGGGGSSFLKGNFAIRS